MIINQAAQFYGLLEPYKYKDKFCQHLGDHTIIFLTGCLGTVSRTLLEKDGKIISMLKALGVIFCFCIANNSVHYCLSWELNRLAEQGEADEKYNNLNGR